jgi:hypothetical protein
LQLVQASAIIFSPASITSSMVALQIEGRLREVIQLTAQDALKSFDGVFDGAPKNLGCL